MTSKVVCERPLVVVRLAGGKAVPAGRTVVRTEVYWLPSSRKFCAAVNIYMKDGHLLREVAPAQGIWFTLGRAKRCSEKGLARWAAVMSGDLLDVQMNIVDLVIENHRVGI